MVFQEACPSGKKKESNTAVRVGRCFLCLIQPLNFSQPEHYSLQDLTQQMHPPIALYAAAMLLVATMLRGSHAL